MKHKIRLFFLLISLVAFAMIFKADGNDKIVYGGVSLVSFLIWCFVKAFDDDALLQADADNRGVWHPKLGDTIFVLFLGWFFLGGGLVTIISFLAAFFFAVSKTGV